MPITLTIARIFTAFLTLTAVLPLFPVGTWWIRLGDFPRLQLAVLTLIPLACLLLIGFLQQFSTEVYALIGLCCVLIAWQGSHFLPYSPAYGYEIKTRSESDPRGLQVAVANLKFDNPDKPACLEVLRNFQTDLLLLIEVNQEWDDLLVDLHEDYPHRESVVMEEGLGLALYSKRPFKKTEVRYLITETRPSIFAEVELDNGEVLHFVGLHPAPPGLYDEKNGNRHDSRLRDGELMLVAEEVADEPNYSWLVTGDFNDVAWSHTTRLFKRLSGLKDPRVGRKLLTTYHSEYPPLRYPIDHVFLTENARLGLLERRYLPGSDHFGVVVDFALVARPDLEPEPEGNDEEQADEMVEEGLEDAAERGIEAK
ncbi:endonuclease/exonuclease/phosphatase family protein [Rubinisphaera brasiliensis]|uniref:Endonuclease/exonuclease/phosphatase n=1 Tax=Rubinisphaera brasiliensis (strain ATCC 49424 / DSM 5305 / JCM 21570 / IAM 15109 / NBRC 103401 / IFAM 1448) TaxID=756272 RepID=F0SS63_RUBBR|nr:endonuclease/exonuclease/phosphatase family protein [Rubinisphaera brasiliensis]ADY58074.1 Endonuclease/exonuclease/phosphatase [Rubinisphaera brasiliensis DSM 5305]